MLTSASTHNERVSCLARASINPHALLLDEFQHRMRSIFASDAATPIPAEGRHVTQSAVGVHPDGSCLDPLCHPQGAANILSPDARAEAINAVVGDPHRILLVVEPDDREDGTEHLLLGDAHVVGDA